MLWAVTAERYGCFDSNCIIAYNIQQPNHWKTPSYVIGGEAASYNIAANHPEKYSRLVFRHASLDSDVLSTEHRDPGRQAAPLSGVV